MLFLFHETCFHALSFELKVPYFVGTPNSFFFPKDSSFLCCDLSKNHPNKNNVFVFIYLLLSIKDK